MSEGIHEQVRKELKHIPISRSLPQSLLRQYYASLRKESLGKKAEKNVKKEDVLKESIEAVKKEYPDFVPQFDKDFFDLEL